MTARAESTAKPRERLTRERVIDAALRIMDAEGIEAVTMRRVAREVGVEAMSLYNHVADKEDLLDGVCARVMADFRFPDEEGDWVATTRHGASEWRRVLKSHPNVLALFAERTKPMTDLDALMPMEFALRTIGRAGMTEREAVQVFNVMGGYIMGFVMMESGRMFGGGAMEKDAPSPDQIAHVLAGGQLPCVAAALPHLASCDPDEQFAFGLDLLLAGLQARYGLPVESR
ncbi:MAG: TetR/AcrR family transcriptional regulator C-terminal domain-containing protein [Actinomycetota bacterium]